MRGAAFAAALVSLAGCTGGSASTGPSSASTLAPATSAPTTTSQTTAAPAGPMLTDDALRAAIQGNYEVLIVRVTKAEAAGAGSRSELTRYTLEVVETPRGSSKGTIQLSQNGAPQLASGKSYAITTRDGNPMWGTKGVRESVEIASGQESAAAKSYRDKLTALQPR